MTIHQRPLKAASGRRAFVRLSVPIEPGASPRAALEAQAAFLIDLLDRLDPDPDLEDNGDLEPNLGQGCREDLDDAEGDMPDDEPSLGSLHNRVDQRGWNGGGDSDCELDRSDVEPRTNGRRQGSCRPKQIPDHSPAIQINRTPEVVVSEVSL